MSTGKEQYEILVKTHLAPGLRDMGFKGSGNAYVLADDTYWAQIGLQKSVDGTRDDVRFTINLSAVSKAGWSEWGRGDRPAANTSYGHSSWFQRIGILIDGNDKWWPLDSDTDLESLSNEVLDAVARYGLPALRVKLTVP